jgi:uncharacterized membrane protein YeaQ/YmgE (transglycosylase-associated protein family)
MGVGVLLLAFAVSGLVVGALARLALPGPDPMGWLATMGFGLAGSFTGGIIGLLIRLPWLPDILVSVACAAGLIWYFRRRGRPGPPDTTPTAPPPDTR